MPSEVPGDGESGRNDDVEESVEISHEGKMKNREWIAGLESREIVSEMELRRVMFLETLVQDLIERPEALAEFELPMSSAELQTLYANTQIRINAFFADESGNTNTGVELRDQILNLECVLRMVREKAGATVDSQLEIGKATLSTRETVGLALGGGGVWGFAHAGIFEVFQEEGIPINLIAGASMGALAGGMISGFIDEQGQITKEGVEYAQRVVRNIRTREQLFEKKNGAVVVPLDVLLFPDGCNDLVGKFQNVPYWAQVAESTPGNARKEVMLKSEPGTLLTDLLREGGIVAASASSKRINYADPVTDPEMKGDKGITYKDDDSIAFFSVSAATRVLRENGAAIVIGVPLGFIDTDTKFFKWLQKCVDRVTGKGDRGDIEIRPKDGHAPRSSQSLTNKYKGPPSDRLHFAQSEKELLSDNGTIPIAVEDFIRYGRESTMKVLPEIFAKLGLVAMTDTFEKEPPTQTA